MSTYRYDARNGTIIDEYGKVPQFGVRNLEKGIFKGLTSDDIDPVATPETKARLDSILNADRIPDDEANSISNTFDSRYVPRPTEKEWLTKTGYLSREAERAEQSKLSKLLPDVDKLGKYSSQTNTSANLANDEIKKGVLSKFKKMKKNINRNIKRAKKQIQMPEEKPDTQPEEQQEMNESQISEEESNNKILLPSKDPDDSNPDINKPIEESDDIPTEEISDDNIKGINPNGLDNEPISEGIEDVSKTAGKVGSDVAEAIGTAAESTGGEIAGSEAGINPIADIIGAVVGLGGLISDSIGEALEKKKAKISEENIPLLSSDELQGANV